MGYRAGYWRQKPCAGADRHEAFGEDRESSAYRLGVRQLREWHRLCAERRAKAAKEKEVA